ncbi:alpha/beta hydrolase [Granulosicoccus antarcticus]|uniref:Esterase EstD n=1 Tax=Granulosicoccus antarcticus IMCC3135 TaxID=1192854 RepID=A0A2Z2P1C1_9GAMM|nr:alpha/beta hydrolase [Granulosicoccus antarcticus]ASJ76595.1 Esterase EstD [Granulosicoccus antarcticus IMCC3135]
MIEDNISIDNEGHTLAGALTRPNSGPATQTVLLIGGSGPLDRNQNSSNLQLNLFNTLAEHLVQAGIASVRYDKRGCGISTGNIDAAGHTDLVEDASRWLRYLQTHVDFKDTQLFVLGHGEGALIGAQLAARYPAIVGLIMLAPSTENYAAVIERQAQNALQEITDLPGLKGKLFRFFLRLGGDQIAKQKKLIAKIMKSSRATMKIRKQTINAKWIREMIQQDPLAIHAQVNIPTLAIAGSKDLQSQASDLQQLQSVLQGPFESHVIPDMTHIMRIDPDAPSTRHYVRLAKQDMDERVLTLISDWIARAA